MAQDLEQPTMQLDDFLKSCLEQIVAGIRGAQMAVVVHGACINPVVSVSRSDIKQFDEHSGTLRQNVDFDIAVTVAKTAKSGAGLRVAAFGLGGTIDGGSDLEQSAISRIKFSIPVVLPKQLPRLPNDEGYVEPIR